MKEIIIVGGGASGLAAAISAARHGASVRILEKKEQVGKKLSMTGNGRCNFSNRNLSVDAYYGDSGFVSRFLKGFPTSELVRFFESVGMLSIVRDDGLYPASNQAATVVSVLLAECRRLPVEIISDCNVTAVRKEDDRFFVTTNIGKFSADAVILACGSEASVKDRFSFSAYDILKGFRLDTAPVFPVLTSLFGDEGYENYWAGVRTKATVYYLSNKLDASIDQDASTDHDVSDDGEMKAASFTGELQLTEKGISGIPVFQISHLIIETLLKTKKKQTVTIDFLPDYPADRLLEWLKKLIPEWREKPFAEEQKKCYTVEDSLKGMLPKKLVLSVLKKAGFSAQTLLTELSPIELETLVNTIKSFPYEVNGFGDLSAAQAAAGGLELSEINERFEVKKIPGLFVTGELLNVDGICGGYNLHFAFGSGIIAGETAAADSEAEK